MISGTKTILPAVLVLISLLQAA